MYGHLYIFHKNKNRSYVEKKISGMQGFSDTFPNVISCLTYMICHLSYIKPNVHYFIHDDQ